MSTNKTFKIKTHKCVIKHICIDQCSGSMTFWNGSGSRAFSWSFSSLPSSTKKGFYEVFLRLSYFRYINICIQRQHVIEKSQSRRNLVYLNLLLIDGSAQIITDPDPDPGGPKTYGSYGTQRPTCDHSRTRHHGWGCRQGCWVGSRRGWAAGGEDSCSWRPTASTCPQQGHRVRTVQHMQQTGFKNGLHFHEFIHRGGSVIFMVRESFA